MIEEEAYGEEGYTVAGHGPYIRVEGQSWGGVAFIMGCFLGASLGLLLAPTTGRETRRKIRELSREVRETAAHFYGEAAEQMAGLVEKGRELAREGQPLLRAALDAGIEAYEKEKQVARREAARR